MGIEKSFLRTNSGGASAAIADVDLPDIEIFCKSRERRRVQNKVKDTPMKKDFQYRS
jgi:hypothetical protein